MSQDLNHSEVFRQRLLAQGILGEEQLDDAMRGYIGRGQGLNFASFLLQQGMLSLSQLADLTTTNQPPPDETTISQGGGDPHVGRDYTGCRVERLLARGGMGAVYVGERLSDGLKVVVKFLATHLAQDEGLRKRFRREGEVLQRLPEHPNVVGVLGLSEEEDPEPHLVMEFVDGVSLERVLAEHWSLPWEEAVRIGIEIAEALAAAHAHGIVHRDVKPANVLVTRDDHVKVVDFGLAKDMFATALTRPGTRLGTPYYMAPEQWGNNDMDARCDVFSLGATLYHLLVGEPPFLGKDAAEVGKKILSGDYAPPRKVVPELPEELELAIHQMLQAERRFRYPRIKLVAEDLERVLQGKACRIPVLIQTGGTAPRRIPLLPGREFTVGRDPASEIHLADPTVSRRHAQLRRGQGGYVLRDLGSTYGTYLGSMRAKRPLVLRNGDRLRMGKVELIFRDPWGERGPQLPPSEVVRKEVAAPILQAMAAMGDVRVLLSLIERLTPDAADDARARGELEALFDPPLVEEVLERRRALETRARARLPMRLQSLTGEDVGREAAEWLEVWEKVRGEYPIQFGMERPPRSLRLNVVRGERGLEDFSLDEGDVFVLGRDDDCSIQLTHRTVSRRHATITRLHRRFYVSDEGSRLGTRVNGDRVERALLDVGDQIELGDVCLELALGPVAEPVARAGIRLFAIDPLSFHALHEMRSPAIATALLGFMHESRRPRWIQLAAEQLYPNDVERTRDMVERVKRIYRRHAEEATELLPGFIGSGIEGRRTARLAAWNQQLAELRDQLPAQVIPIGWLAASRGLWKADGQGGEEDSQEQPSLLESTVDARARSGEDRDLGDTQDD
ncbi:MAG: FHA domain-containing protein [Planctomycetota bacterium]